MAGEEGPDKEKGKRLITDMPPPEPSVCIEDLFTVYFEKDLDPIPHTKLYNVTCNFCDIYLTFNEKQGYNNLIVHLRETHPEWICDDSSEGSTGTDPSIFRYSHNRAKTAAAKLVCSESLPISFIDSETFENVRRDLIPEAKRFTGPEVIDEINRLVKETTSALITGFERSSKVSICLDIWNDAWDHWRYIRITCHWTHDWWILQKRLIAFKCFLSSGSPLTAATIARVTLKLLQKYGLEKKVFSISLDNDSAKAVNLESLANACKPSIGANFFHVRCICDILSQCAQDALSTFEKKVASIRKAAKRLFNGGSSLQKKWARHCKRNGLNPKIFVVDLAGRWDSSYKMLNGTYEYRDALCSFFSKQDCGIELSPSQWDACSDLSRILKTLKDAVEELSGVYYSTSVLVMDQFVKIAVLFNSLIGCDDLGGLSSGMIARWLEHFLEIPMVFLIAKVLDPRVRINGLEKMLEIYYDALFPTKDDSTPLPTTIVANVRTCLHDMFQEYSSRSGIYTWKLRSSGGANNPYAEIESYLTADFEYVDAEFDVLKWWPTRTLEFPVLFCMAKHVLAVPASTVSAEQAFSTLGGGRVLDEGQTAMSFQNLENQFLLGDWVKADWRSQENKYEEEQEDMSLVGLLSLI